MSVDAIAEARSSALALATVTDRRYLYQCVSLANGAGPYSINAE